MSAFDDGLRRLYLLPADDILETRVYDVRTRNYGRLMRADVNGFGVRFPMEGRDTSYPVDAFSSGVLRLEEATERRLRPAILELGRDKALAAEERRRRPAAFDEPGAAAPMPPPVTMAPVVTGPTLTQFERAVGLVLLPTGPNDQARVNLVVGLPVISRETGAQGTIAKVDWKPVLPPFPGERPQDYAERRRKAETKEEFERWVVSIAAPGTRKLTPVLDADLLDLFSIPDAAMSMPNARAIVEEADRIGAIIASRAEAATGLSERPRATPTPMSAAVTAMRRREALAAAEGTPTTTPFASTLEAEIIGMTTARPVAITFVLSSVGYIFNMVPINQIALRREDGTVATGLNAVLRELRNKLPVFRDAWEEDRDAWVAAGSQGKAPVFPWAVIAVEMSNGTRLQLDPKTGQFFRDRSSEEVTRRIEAAITLPKVSRTHPDARAANEMRDNLLRVGATEYGPGGRRYASEELRSEFGEPRPGRLFTAADPNLPGQTRSGEDLYRYRGKSKFQRMVEATPVTETAETRAARARQLGAVSRADLRDVEEALAIAAGERITASASETTFRRQIKLKEGERPDGRYIKLRDNEYLIIGTERRFTQPRAEAFLRAIGLTPVLVTLEDLTGG